jgi:hypothetical protein
VRLSSQIINFPTNLPLTPPCYTSSISMIKPCGRSLYRGIILLIGIIAFIPALALADGLFQTTPFQPLVGIPGVTDTQTDPNNPVSFNSYINALYIFAITAGALLAVIKLIVAGVKYMFSDVVTTKSDATKEIKGALLGLLIVVGSVVILNTINPDITNFDLMIMGVELDTTGVALPTIEDREADFCAAVVATGRECEIRQCTTGMLDAVGQIIESCESWCQGINGFYVEPYFGFLNAYCRYPGNIEIDNAVSVGDITLEDEDEFIARCGANSDIRNTIQINGVEVVTCQLLENSSEINVSDFKMRNDISEDEINSEFNKYFLDKNLIIINDFTNRWGYLIRTKDFNEEVPSDILDQLKEECFNVSGTHLILSGNGTDNIQPVCAVEIILTS